MDIVVDVNDLTLGEVEQLEELTGLSVEDFGPGMKWSAKIVTAFVYISQKRNNPDYTLEDARKVKLGEFEPSSRPTEAAASETD